MEQPRKRGFDYTTFLLLIVVAACLIGIFGNPVQSTGADWYAARSAAKLYFHNVYLECAVEGIVEDYTGDVLVIENEYNHYKLVEIRDYFLVGSNVRHVRFDQLPKHISTNAFAGVEGVTVYTDWEITGDIEWAKNVTIRPTEDFAKLMDPDVSYEFDFSFEQLVNFAKRWAGDEKVMLGTTVPLALVMFVLCFLRQKSGRSNPLWPVFRSGIGKWLFIIFSFAVGLFTAITLFCEEVDMGLDVYGVVEFMLGWPLYVMAAIAGLFLLSDLLSKDFPWFFARWVVRAAITLVIILFCALVGYVAAVIVTENIGLFKTLYILGLIIFVSLIMGGGGVTNNSIKSKMHSSTAISSSGESMRVDYYSHGTYVGGDQIVGFGADTLTGISGAIYKKF